MLLGGAVLLYTGGLGGLGMDFGSRDSGAHRICIGAAHSVPLETQRLHG